MQLNDASDHRHWLVPWYSLLLGSASVTTSQVKEGDAVEPGQPLAQEWAATKCAGVPRFQAPDLS